MYVLLFDSYDSHHENNISKNVKTWLNNVYKDKYSQDLRTASSVYYI